jgi:hypothetical protein
MQFTFWNKLFLYCHPAPYFLILLFLLPMIGPAQRSADSLVPANISIKFLRNSQPYEIFSPSLSSAQLFRSWLWRSGVNYPLEFHWETKDYLRHLKSGTFPDFDRYSEPIYDYPGADYRGTSYYLPENVREYIDFKMGREPYLPVFNPVILGFILYNLRHYLLQNEQESSLQSELTLAEVKLLQVLLEEYPLDEQQWYNHYRQASRDSLFSIPAFQKAVEKLRKKSLVLWQSDQAGDLKYYPSATAPSFYLRPGP